MITLWKRSNSRRADPPATPPKAKPTGPGAAFIPPLPPTYEVVAGLLTDIGCVRTVNEDCCRYVKPDDPELLARKGILAIVADGMGGHAAGEVASESAVKIIERVYYQSARPPQDALEEAFQAANRAIHQASFEQPRLRGMGTTCTALVVHQGVALSAQVGDSRLYLVRRGEIYLMSEDHSAVMEMVRRGMMTLEEAHSHADKNIILRALGPRPEISVTTWPAPFPIRDEDQFVLCSDGLYDLVSNEEIKQHVLAGDPQPACEQLTALAKGRGGHDNITVGVLRFEVVG